VPHGDPDRHLKDAFPFSAGDRRFLVLTDRNIPIYEALDETLSRWTYRGLLDAHGAECPNFFEVDGRWMYLSSPNKPVRYVVGDFDAETVRFTPRADGRINHDMSYYASTSYRDNQDRTILHGVSRGQKSSRAWTGVLALPRVLTIGPDGRPRMHPVPALASLRREAFHLAGPVTLAGRAQTIDGLKGDTLEIVARFNAGSARAFGLRVRRSADGERALPVMWRDGRIVVAKDTPDFPCEYVIAAPNREIEFHLFLDKGILEVGTSDGRVFETRVHQAPLEDLGVEIFSEGGTVTLLALDAWQMAPAHLNHSMLLGSQ
jgi:beta-fructofuranosidase